ncbi:fumarylacetoacetate hydrolase family protein [Umezawaea endophytica]|uniref:Fumarylacetoacetate hydrolase family protein n=1 Tax=Umezawaea endophytica TaxID=1654476 RepID=A0A9X3AGP8_9PSEU|nr:fumarylacetoacetate hydrolase family protein [Umezawaea endophytica]MCS7480392.1 fumarylacetoacetate hydrolase family protein [Umezawaea endophytica]
MEIRRRLTTEGTLVVETRPFQDSPWLPSDSKNALGYEPAFSQEWEAERAAAHHVGENGEVLPFQPLSFRDFMFYEQHNIDAARGYIGRFRPQAAKVIKGFETLTRSTFPRFRPNRLWYRQPTYYMGNMATIVPSGTPVTAPPFSRALDYELELGFVLNAPLLNARPAEAEEAIGMFVLLCDFSARDVQIPEMNSGFGPQKSKHFLTSLATTAVTAADLLPRWRELKSRVIINGEVVARPDARKPQWTMGQALAHASAGEQLYPGELFAIGTLHRGCGMEIGRWLKPGDQLRLEMDDVGVIEHAIH